MEHHYFKLQVHVAHKDSQEDVGSTVKTAEKKVEQAVFRGYNVPVAMTDINMQLEAAGS